MGCNAVFSEGSDATKVAQPCRHSPANVLPSSDELRTELREAVEGGTLTAEDLRYLVVSSTLLLDG